MDDNRDAIDLAYYCVGDCPTPGIYDQSALSYDLLLDLMAAYTTLPPPEPVKLTQEQWDKVKELIGVPTAGSIPELAPLYGVPVHFVECVEDSTPYQRWRRNHVHFAAEPSGHAGD